MQLTSGEWFRLRLKVKSGGPELIDYVFGPMWRKLTKGLSFYNKKYEDIETNSLGNTKCYIVQYFTLLFGIWLFSTFYNWGVLILAIVVAVTSFKLSIVRHLQFRNINTFETHFIIFFIAKHSCSGAAGWIDYAKNMLVVGLRMEEIKS